MTLAIVQVRSTVDMDTEIEDTLEMLNLGGVNNLTVIPEEPSYTGMVKKVNDYVAFGEPDSDTLELVLGRRGETLEEEELTEEYVEEETEYGSISELAEAVLSGETTLKEAGVSPTVRLHPPRKGHGGAKTPKTEGGVLGNHEEEIDELIKSMR
ncbi:MAG: 50S ribosomal protein L30 [Halobacteria archaeon]